MTDNEITRDFVAKLNPARKYAGQIVTLDGKLTNIIDDNASSRTGFQVYFMLDDGTKLIVHTPLIMLQHPEKIGTITGELIGIRDRRDESSSWDELELFPAIRIRRMGESSDPSNF